MISFKDKSFTKHPQCNCARKWTPELAAQAEKWWGGPGAPVAFVAGCTDCFGKTVPSPTDKGAE